MTTDTLRLSPAELDLSLAATDVDEAKARLIHARHRLQRYPHLRAIVDALDVASVGLDVIEAAMTDTV